MQYLLTEEEYVELVHFDNKSKKSSAEIINQLCTLVADHMPITKYPGSEKEPTPWGCRITQDDWYCDNCPVIKFCSRDKAYSS